MMATLRGDQSLDVLRSSTNELISTAREQCMNFLRVELELAQTLMDMAASAREESARRRRLERAAEATKVVERFVVAPPPTIRLPDAECQRLASELDRVRERLTSMR